MQFRPRKLVGGASGIDGGAWGEERVERVSDAGEAEVGPDAFEAGFVESEVVAAEGIEVFVEWEVALGGEVEGWGACCWGRIYGVERIMRVWRGDGIGG